ncbi:HCL015Cp [Eremothecium sinecaudum]|uniref:Transcription initiation factor TFIID subunit 4 n=1 Tax=Eremothecium sinecaudum TaxID=45286 RepID=A0A0X8HRL0_9SACH|nr:HCL015Cp [Eremothecium sinecaudum]AMD20136.1 HCL015Cp [Eremothecium sinecaudum]
MAKSPKGAGAENARNTNREGNQEGESTSFRFANESGDLDPSGSEFSNDLPPLFDNVSESEKDRIDGLALPQTSLPSTTLVLPKSKVSHANDNKKSPHKVQKPVLNNKAGTTSMKKHTQGAGAPKQQSDPEKLSDALLSAGVDIKEEEALLNSTVVSMKPNSRVSNSQIPPHPPLLHPSHVAIMMKKVAAEQNFNQDFSKSHDLLSLMSTACELYMRDIITNSIIISRHRRKAVKLNSGRRSEITMVLRDLALKQREQEESRVKRRIALGLEKQTLDPKLDSGETLHRASNATANMMIAGGKKKYSWLTSGSKVNPSDLKNAGKVSSAVAARGDLGIKYREAREEPGIVMRDLLRALENRRVSVSNTIAKGYARIRD